VLNGFLIVAAILIVGAFLSARRARRRDPRAHSEFVRSGGDSGGADVPAFMFFGTDTPLGHGHDHHPGDPTGDWSSASDGGASGGGGASGSFDGAGASDGGAGGDGGGAGDGGGGGGGD